MVRFRSLLVGGGVYCRFPQAGAFGKPSLRSVERFASSANTSSHHKKSTRMGANFLVGGGGFEPPKSETSDLQSDAFGHSAIRPYLVFYPAIYGVRSGAGDWNRTHNLLITNQLLCQLSYTSKPQRWCLGVESNRRHMDFQSTALPTELPRRKRLERR